MERGREGEQMGPGRREETDGEGEGGKWRASGRSLEETEDRWEGGTDMDAEGYLR